MEGEKGDVEESRIVPSRIMEHETNESTAATLRHPGVASGAANPSTSSSAPFLLPTALDASAELPFLVTNYLAHYQHQKDAQEGSQPGANRARPDEQEGAAVERIRKAAGELAAAFEALGAFGMVMRPDFTQHDASSPREYDDHDDARNRRIFLADESLPWDASTLIQQRLTPASFSDIKLRWSRTTPNQLESLVHSAVSAGSLLERHSELAPNLVQASHEARIQATRQPASGRTLSDAIDIDAQRHSMAAGDFGSGDNLSSLRVTGLSRPVLVQAANATSQVTDAAATASTLGRKNPPQTVTLDSSLLHFMNKASVSLRTLLDLRDNLAAEDSQIRQIEQSIRIQLDNRDSLSKQLAGLSDNAESLRENDNGASTRARLLDEIDEGEKNCTRVLAQLHRDLDVRSQRRNTSASKVHRLEQELRVVYTSLRQILLNFRDPLYRPFHIEAGKPLRNYVLQSLAARERGLSVQPIRCVSTTAGSAVANQRRAVLMSRISHAATINTHLAYPIYCLRFDKSGRYFITGADDCLARVFAMGGTNQGNAHHPTTPVARHVASDSSLRYARGAVLVCTLRGHAGVINDIDVSSDNSFLATASEDGDCRVWGLKDGCPVAILRGHVGGANMVSWSTLTPYRLVTTGADGYARTWDVREACLKRYGKVIGRRPEYRLQSTSKIPNQDRLASSTSSLSPCQTPPPRSDQPHAPLNARQDGEEHMRSSGAGFQMQSAASPQEPSIPLPPLPPPQNAQAQPVPLPLPPLPPAAPQGNENIDEGAFVANDVMDEGVKLLSRLKHTHEEDVLSPGARSRRAPIKVICLARCPHGGHFATGSDDGVCRVWRDEDDPVVNQIDSRFFSSRDHQLGDDRRNADDRSSDRFAPGRLLISLKSHESAITDLQYSYAGDRLLTASQKDGVVNVYYFSRDPLHKSDPRHRGTQLHHFKESHVSIQLANAHASSRLTTSSQGTRRRPRHASSSVSCDVACWICDDSKIVTSQSELVKQSGTEINPGSQFIFLWDSFNGSCLLGIAGAHEKQCPAVIPHPFDSNILCSAGADGFLKLWDCESGRVIFLFENILEFGPHDPNDNGKPCGFLDGSFSPDGTELVLADDSGRVIVFDCSQAKNVQVQHTPMWMREQYFANDYYDLLYDPNGYCIERGSELPPHLAPTGVRCSHGGVPHADIVTRTFKKLIGPMPLSEVQARFNRRRVAHLHEEALEREFDIPGCVVQRFDPKMTIVITGSGPAALLESMDSVATDAGMTASISRRVSSRQPSRLSSNWRWIGYDDLERSEGPVEDVEDPDDEEYEQTEGRRAFVDTTDADSEADDDDMSVRFEDSPVRSRRSSSRYEDAQSGGSDSEFDEFMSTNRTPTGPLIADYETHFYRMASKTPLLREWLLRTESNTSFAGRKCYAPQVGDTVAYIPRAHYEVIKLFPRLSRPWLQWPRGVTWPVVRCIIRSLRYRFPFKDYIKPRKGKMRSIVALLTLEITGVPDVQHAENRRFSWPAPVFSDPPKRLIFELSMFMNEGEDFLIPLGLYEQRLSRLELYGKEQSFVDVFYKEIDSSSDPTLRAFRGRIDSFEQYSSTEALDPRIDGSGFQSITVRWIEDGAEENLSPWELDIIADAVDEVRRSKLKEEEKRKVLKALASLRDFDEMSRLFFEPVDMSKYSDYENMIEVPMDLSFVSSRVETDYYVSMLSVFSDFQLVYDNCVKYNGSDDDLAVVAGAMLEKFSTEVLSDEDRASVKEFEVYAVANVDAWRLQPPESVPDNHVNSNRNSRRSSDAGNLTSARGSRLRPRALTHEAVLSSRYDGLHRRSRNASNQNRQQRQRLHNHRRAVSGNDSGRVLRRRAMSSRGRMISQLESVTSQPQLQVSSRPVRIASRTRSRMNEEPDEETMTRRHTRATRASSSGSGPTRDPALTPRAPSRSSRSVSAFESFHAESSLDERIRRSRAFESARTESGDSSRAALLTEPRARRSVTCHGQNVAQGESVVGTQRRSHRAAVTEARGRTRQDDDPEDVSSSSEQDEPKQRRSRSAVSRNASKRLPRSNRSAGQGDTSSDDDHSEAPDDDSSAEPNQKKVKGHKRSDSIVDENSSSGVDVFAQMESSSEDDDDSVNPSTKAKKAATTWSSSRRSSRVSTISLAAGREDAPDSRRRSGLRAHSSKCGLYAEKSEAEFTDSDSSVVSSPPPPTKKRKTASRELSQRAYNKKIKEEPVNALAKPKDWPEIDMRHITKVTKEILERLRTLDESRIFEWPVIESFPEVADSYLEVIDDPMDFRTIEEERLPAYRSIRELQADLILTFENCVKFNPGTEYSELAKTLTEMLENLFRDVCQSCNVLLPRRW